MRNRSAFTLIEILLVVGLIAIMAAVVPVVSTTYLASNQLESSTQIVASSARRAQALAYQMEHDDGWGVAISGSSVIVFKGNDFATRDQSFDEVSILDTSITFSGDSEISFLKFDANPVATGSITLTNNFNDSLTVSVNSEGSVQY